MLQQGGNAIDAALAAVWVEMVVLPMATGLGGDMLAMVWETDQDEPMVLMSFGHAPRNPDPEVLEWVNHHGLPPDGMMAASVPAAVAGLEALRESGAALGRWPVMAPAIHYAHQGFPMSDRGAALTRRANLRERPAAGLAAFLENQQADRPGAVVRQEDLAEILVEIVEDGKDGFYHGRFGRALMAAQESRRWFSEDDLAIDARWMRPLAWRTGTMTVYSTPPPSAGDVVALAGNLLTRSSFSEDSVPGIEEMIRARRLSLTMRDAAFSEDVYQQSSVDVSHPVFQELQQRFVKGDLPSWPELGHGTSLVVAVDKQRQVAVMHSLSGVNFGSGYLVPNTGVVLNGRLGRGLGLPYRPGALPWSTLNLVAVADKRNGRILGGTPGGDQQSLWVLQAIARLRTGLSLAEAVTRPRWFDEAGSRRRLVFEENFPAELVTGLATRGWSVRTLPLWTATGGYQWVVRSGETLYAVSDPRIHGTAIGI